MTKSEGKTASAAVKDILLLNPDGLHEVIRAVMQEVLEAEMEEALGASKVEANGRGVTLADYSMICLEKYRDTIAFDWSAFASINRYFDAMRATDAWSRADSDLEALRKAA